MNAFVGIDVAFAKRKRLPVSLCVRSGRRIIPLPLAERGMPISPRGRGNAATLDDNALNEFAEEVAAYLRSLEIRFGVAIRRIGIDAPSDPRAKDLVRRKAEEALDLRRISCFTTPSSDDFVRIREKVASHLACGGSQACLPHANQLWMLVGFALFARLRREWECLEVFPQATACVLGANSVHKSHRGGVDAQLAVVARFTGWPDPPTVASLKAVVQGPLHDGLDAYMSAWVAALESGERFAFGQPPGDAIWVAGNCAAQRISHLREHCIRGAGMSLKSSRHGNGLDDTFDAEARRCGFGGLFNESSLPQPLDQPFTHHRQRIEAFIAGIDRVRAAREQLAVVFSFTDSPAFNAFASTVGRRHFIGMPSGTVLLLYDLFLRILAARDILPGIGKPRTQRKHARYEFLDESRR